MKANEIIRILDNYKDSKYQKILINGDWGIGKTKYILDFINNYTNACYVSLFGKRDVNSILQDIYFHLIKNTPGSKIRKNISSLREKMNTLDISYFGISLSIPMIEDIHKTLIKELNRKDTFIIVFDDLERKHHELDIKEVFGVIDSLSRIEKIKIVLVAATNQFGDENENTFINYHEKAIDRAYIIEKYADEAPVQILGEDVWGVIENITENYKFTNLRTFGKTNLFINEVIGVLGEQVFTEKFTKGDLYRMCFASVFFIIEHKRKMVLLDDNGPDSKYMRAYYSESENGVIEYLSNCILRESWDNSLSKMVFYHINKWFEIGEYSKETILNLIASINNFKEKPHNFYSSEEEILDIIRNTKEYMLDLNGSEEINDIILNFSTASTWCEQLSVDFGISNEQVLDLINKNIANKIDITKDLVDNFIGIWDHRVESGNVACLVELIDEKLKSEYINQLLNQINMFFERKLYNSSYLKQLRNSIRLISDEHLRDSILKSLNNNYYFFSIPSGRISEQQWRWCHQINKLIREIENNWEVTNYYSDFKAYIYRYEITKKDRMLQYRLKQLFEKQH